MAESLGDRVFRGEMTRRDILWIMGVSAASAAAPAVLTGCATSPVTGQSMLAGISEQEEVAIDRQQSPHQFSNDYGAVQDARLNGYLTQVGNSLATRSHRPQMPYNYRVVNANYVNAYTIFLKGLAQEGMQNRAGAAREYQRYLRATQQGDQAKYSAQRLQAWGYLK